MSLSINCSAKIFVNQGFDTVKCNPVKILPNELILNIFSYLNVWEANS